MIAAALSKRAAAPPIIKSACALASVVGLACIGGCTKPSPSGRASSPAPSVAESSAAPLYEAPAAAAGDAGSGARAEFAADGGHAGLVEAAASAASMTHGEAKRFTIARIDEDPLLRAQGALLREHFGGAAQGPFAEQIVDLATGAKALLVARADESDPIVVAVDRDRLEWQKPRPVVGMVLPAAHVTLAPRPDGGAAVFVWVEKLRTVAARMWAEDGNAFGDFEVFRPDRCDAMSVAYGPGWGWIVACTSPAGVRAARLREDATLAGDASGVALGSGHSTGAVAMAFDSRVSFVLVEPAAGAGADHILAFRYDTGFAPLWPTPVDLGLAARSSSRVGAEAGGAGIVRVDTNARGPHAVRTTSVEVTSSGEVRRALPVDRPAR